MTKLRDGQARVLGSATARVRHFSIFTISRPDVRSFVPHGYGGFFPKE